MYKCDDSGEFCFGIYDAKYYNVDFSKNASGYRIIGQPGIGDVTKQYLYQLAYDDFITKQGYKYVQNVFLCPDEAGDNEYGWVQMDMLHKIGGKKLNNVAVVKLCAPEMYSLYLSNHTIDENEMTKYISVSSRQEVNSQNFAKRMIEYLVKITDTNNFAEKKFAMKSDTGKLIYPQQLKRELGAKIIYDTICPVASNVFYRFSPYEKEDYENMVAEDTGNSYKLCNQLADASIEIEKIIKNLSEEKLKDEKAMKSLLKECIENKADIKSMAKERYLDMLTDKIMELIKDVYL
ncbi:MAG: LlaJI family restriction endonuclease [Selenomonadaceae bacterium]|nr:LlaJI family restriction endonuclease [Selenomonadaceae bacterium]